MPYWCICMCMCVYNVRCRKALKNEDFAVRNKFLKRENTTFITQILPLYPTPPLPSILPDRSPLPSSLLLYKYRPDYD